MFYSNAILVKLLSEGILSLPEKSVSQNFQVMSSDNLSTTTTSLNGGSTENHPASVDSSKLLAGNQSTSVSDVSAQSSTLDLAEALVMGSEENLRLDQDTVDDNKSMLTGSFGKYDN